MQAGLVCGADRLEHGVSLGAPLLLGHRLDGLVQDLDLGVLGVEQERCGEGRLALAVDGLGLKELGEGQADVVKFYFHGVLQRLKVCHVIKIGNGC